jgi:hypothetical protein
MKKFIVILALLSVISYPTAFAAPKTEPLCGRIVRRIAPAEPRGIYRYDVLVGKSLKRWSTPTKLAIGARLCV